MKRIRLAVLGGAAAACLALTAAPAADANVVTLESPLTASFGTFNCMSSMPCTFVQTALPGAKLTSPVDGTVVRWRVKNASGPGGFKLRILRPAGFGTFTGVGTSVAGNPISTGTEAFPTNLPIKTGDSVGLDPTNTAQASG